MVRKAGAAAKDTLQMLIASIHAVIAMHAVASSGAPTAQYSGTAPPAAEPTMNYQDTTAASTFMDCNDCEFGISETDVDLPGMSARYMQAGLILITALADVLASILFIVTVKKVSGEWKPSLLMLLSLGVMDLLFGVLVHPAWIHSIVTFDWQLGSALCKATAFLTVTFMTAASLFFMAYASDRYFLIVNPTQHKKLTRLKGIVLTIGIWSLGAALGAAPLAGFGGYVFKPGPVPICTIAWEQSHILVGLMLILLCLVPALVITLCYVRVLQISRTNQERLDILQNSLSNPKYTIVNSISLSGKVLNPAKVKMVLRSMRFITVMQCVYLLTMGPYLIVNGRLAGSSPPYLVEFLLTYLVYSHPVFTSIFLLFGPPELRRMVLSIMRHHLPFGRCCNFPSGMSDDSLMPGVLTYVRKVDPGRARHTNYTGTLTVTADLRIHSAPSSEELDGRIHIPEIESWRPPSACSLELHSRRYHHHHQSAASDHQPEGNTSEGYSRNSVKDRPSLSVIVSDPNLSGNGSEEVRQSLPSISSFPRGELNGKMDRRSPSPPASVESNLNSSYNALIISSHCSVPMVCMDGEVRCHARNPTFIREHLLESPLQSSFNKYGAFCAASHGPDLEDKILSVSGRGQNLNRDTSPHRTWGNAEEVVVTRRADLSCPLHTRTLRMEGSSREYTHRLQPPLSVRKSGSSPHVFSKSKVLPLARERPRQRQEDSRRLDGHRGVYPLLEIDGKIHEAQGVGDTRNVDLSADERCQDHCDGSDRVNHESSVDCKEVRWKRISTKTSHPSTRVRASASEYIRPETEYDLTGNIKYTMSPPPENVTHPSVSFVDDCLDNSRTMVAEENSESTSIVTRTSEKTKGGESSLREEMLSRDDEADDKR